MNGLWWLLIPLVPLLMGLLLLRWRDAIVPWLWLASLPALLAAFWPPVALSLPWLWSNAQWGADDLVARAFLGFTALLWGCAGIYAVVGQRQDPRRMRFWAGWSLALSGNLLLIIAQDAVSFYMGFTVMSLAAYSLVVHLGGPGPRQAGRVYLQLAVLGEMLLYAGLMLRMQEAGGAMGFVDWQTAPVGALTAALLLLGFGLKAGFWPLHVWLPLAHPAAPAAASAVLSGAMIKAGILGLWRFMPEADPLLESWAGGLFAIGMISAFYGVLLGLVQRHAKVVLAYSSISQMGYLLAILALAWGQPENVEAWAVLLALYAVHHGLAKGALFMGAGLAGRYRLSRYWWLVMAIPALALAGIPVSSGVAVKSLLKEGVDGGFMSNWLPFLTVGSIATALLMARALWLMRRAQEAATASAGPQLLYPWAALSLMPLLLPWIWSPLREPLVASLTLAGSWAALWPLIVVVVAVAGALHWAWKVPASLTRLPDPARYLSLRVKRLLQRPPLPPLEPEIKTGSWRRRERKWNRFWQRGTVAASAWLLALLLLLGWVW